MRNYIMNHYQLIHWNEQEAQICLKLLNDLKFEVLHEKINGPEALKRLREDRPRAFLIDLSRMPSQGRDIALLLRKNKGTRFIPLVFIGGDPAKVDNIRKHLPDAFYTSWKNIESDLIKAVSSVLHDPVVPKSQLEGYSDSPLIKKLGVKNDSKIALINAPDGFEKSLNDMPGTAHVDQTITEDTNLILWFCKSQNTLENEIASMARRITDEKIWIIWPKKTSGVTTDLTQNTVRKEGLAHGLVDYKICSIDKTWSGLLFRRRK